MTVIVKVGRRVPKSYLKRKVQKIKSLLSFQENTWMMIVQSFNIAKRKANSSNTGIKFVKTTEIEKEDLINDIEWIFINIQGSKEQEEEEYNEAMGMYEEFKKQFKKNFPKNGIVNKFFKTSKLTPIELDECYTKGMGAISDNNIANKLLELGIITHIKWVHDYHDRTPDV